MQDFEKLDTQVKSAFTRAYNQKTQSNTTGVVRKLGGGGRGVKAKPEQQQSEGEEDPFASESEAEEDEMLDEEEILDRKKGRQLDKEAAEKGKIEKASTFEMLQLAAKKGGAKTKEV